MADLVIALDLPDGASALRIARATSSSVPSRHAPSALGPPSSAIAARSALCPFIESGAREAMSRASSMVKPSISSPQTKSSMPIAHSSSVS